MRKKNLEHHVVIFPCPAQGHVNSMLKLAQLLSLHHLHVTFLNTEHIHRNLLRYGDIEDLLASYPTLQFKTIPDGLPHHHTRSDVEDVINSVNSHAKPHLREILISQTLKATCFIADGIFGCLTADVADEVQIPIIHFRTISASCFWTYFSFPNLFQCNELPVKGDEDMDRVITSISGMENLLRCRDLPSFCHESSSKIKSPLELAVFETHQSLRARALILNTFEDLEGSVLSQIRLKFPRVFAVGPLHAQLKHRGESISNTIKTTPSTSCIWKPDRSCMTWLDTQPLRSVIYVSFGSIATMTREMVTEIWYGLVNSKKRFLWVIRHNMVERKDNDDRIPEELEVGTKERGFIVGWAPQEEVLAHGAIGGFLTHSGWNSTLESIVALVPMICWPYFGDQRVNSRLVSEAWKLGLDMKHVVCERNVVENMVNDVMVKRKDEFLKSAEAMAMLANKSVSLGGSSYSDLDRLFEYIQSINKEII